MVQRVFAADLASPSVMSERDLRRHIDRSVARALVDSDYARVLLRDPTVVLEDLDCPPQQFLSLLSIQASDLLDFARQAQALFWAFERSNAQALVDEDAVPLAATAR